MGDALNIDHHLQNSSHQVLVLTPMTSVWSWHSADPQDFRGALLTDFEIGLGQLNPAPAVPASNRSC